MDMDPEKRDHSQMIQDDDLILAQAYVSKGRTSHRVTGF